MKIVYLHQYFNTPSMSGGTRSYEMAKRLVASGHEVHIVTSWVKDTHHPTWFEEDIDGIKVLLEDLKRLSLKIRTKSTKGVLQIMENAVKNELDESVIDATFQKWERSRKYRAK